MGDLFISYAREDDEPFVQTLVADLRSSGIDVWWDRTSMESRGRTFLDELRNAIASAERFLLVLGPRALDSEYVRAEWNAALQHCRVIVPILRSGAFETIPPALALLHAIDFRPSRAYTEALAELTRVLGSEVAPLGQLFAVEALPAHFVGRAGELEALRASVLADVREATSTRPAAMLSGLGGMGGVGKTVLAAALARSCEVRRTFSDGIVWLRFRDDIVTELSYVGRCLAGLGDGTYPDLHTAAARLSEALANKRCLLILDDVKTLAQVELFPDVVGPRCRLLMTTRNISLIKSLGGHLCSLDVLSPTASRELLALSAGLEVDALPPIADDLVTECDGLPLALAIVGAMGSTNVNRWEGALHHLREANLERLAQEFPHYPYPNVFRAIEASVAMLEPEQRDRYLDLAIFSDAGAVPEATLAQYWQPLGLSRHDARELIDLFVSRSLARRGPPDSIVLHDLQLDYTRKRAEDLPSLHLRLVESYRESGGGRWAMGPQDGYYFRMLPRHLMAAKRLEDFGALLLDPEWIEAKLTAEGLPEVVRDYRLGPRARVTELVRAALELSALALSRQPWADVREQLLGRISHLEDEQLSSFRQRLRGGHSRLRLLPTHACLARAGGAMVGSLFGHRGRVNALSSSSNSKLLASCGADRLVIAWDLETNEAIRKFVGHEDEVNAVLALPEHGLVLSGSGFPKPFKMYREFSAVLKMMDLRSSRDSSIRGWDLKSGEQVFRLTGHEGAVRSLAELPGTNHFVSGGDDGIVRIWSLNAPHDGVVLADHQSPVIALRALSDGRLAVVTETGLFIHYLAEGRWSGPLEIDKSWQNILDIQIEKFLLALQWETFDGYFFVLQTWDVLNSTDEREDLRDLHKFERVPISSGAFSRDGDLLAVGLADHTARVFDVASRQLVGWLHGHRGEVTAITFTPDKRHVASGAEDGSVRIWRTDTLPRSIEAPLTSINAIAAMPEGRHAITAAQDGSVALWDLQTGHQTRVLREAGNDSFESRGTPAFSVCVSATENVLAYGLMDGTVVLWSIAEQRQIAQLSTGRGLRAVAFAPDGRSVAVACQSEARIYDLRTQSSLRTFGLTNDARGIGFLNCGRHVVIGDQAGELTFWSVDSGECYRRMESLPSAGPPPEARSHYQSRRRPGDIPARPRPLPGIIELVVEPGEHRCFTACADDTIKVWDLASSGDAPTRELPCAGVLGVAIDPSASYLASVSKEGDLKLWNLHTLEVAAEFVFDQAAYSVAFTADARAIAVGLGDGPAAVACVELSGAKG